MQPWCHEEVGELVEEAARTAGSTSSGGIDSIIGGPLDRSVHSGAPLCATCGAPEEASIEAERVVVACARCGTRASYDAPAALQNHARSLVAIVAPGHRADARRGAIERSAAGVSARCPECGAPLAAAEGSAVTACGHCKATVYLPAETQRGLDAGPKSRVMWFAFRPHAQRRAPAPQPTSTALGSDMHASAPAARGAGKPNAKTGDAFGLALGALGAGVVLGFGDLYLKPGTNLDSIGSIGWPAAAVAAVVMAIVCARRSPRVGKHWRGNTAVVAGIGALGASVALYTLVDWINWLPFLGSGKETSAVAERYDVAGKKGGTYTVTVFRVGDEPGYFSRRGEWKLGTEARVVVHRGLLGVRWMREPTLPP